MSIKLNISKDYEKKPCWTLGENKPNSKPIPNQRTEGSLSGVALAKSERQMAELDNGSKNWAALRSAYKKTLLFALNLIKWTLGEVGKSKIKSQSAK